MATGFDGQTEEGADDNEGQSIAAAPFPRSFDNPRSLNAYCPTSDIPPTAYPGCRPVTTQTEADVLAAQALLMPVASINGTYSEREGVLF